MLADELVHAVLRGPDPLPAEFDPLAVGQVRALGAAADALARLEHDHRAVGPGQAGADHHHVVGVHGHLLGASLVTRVPLSEG